MSIKNILIALFTMIIIFAVYVQFNPRKMTLKESLNLLLRIVSKIKIILNYQNINYNEPRVLDATINDAGYLYVMVKDGTNRNGYASYICLE